MVGYIIYSAFAIGGLAVCIMIPVIILAVIGENFKH